MPLRTTLLGIAIACSLPAIAIAALGAALPAAFKSEPAVMQSRICGRLLFSLTATQAQNSPVKLSAQQVKMNSALLLSGILHMNRTEQVTIEDKAHAHAAANRIEKAGKQEVGAVVAHCVKQATGWMRSGQASREEIRQAFELSTSLLSPAAPAVGQNTPAATKP